MEIAFMPTSCSRSATSSMFLELSSQPNLVLIVTGSEVDLTTASVNLTIRSTSLNTPAPAPLLTTFSHRFFITTKDLDTERTFFFTKIKLHFTLHSIPYQTFA